MQVRYSHHARERMAEQGIAQNMVEAVLEAPEQRIVGNTAHEYRAAVGDRLLHVVISAGPEPASVITVYWVAS